MSDARLQLFLNCFYGLAFVLCFLPNAFDYSTLDRLNADTEGNSIFARIQWFPLFGVAAFLIYQRRRLAWDLLRHANPFAIMALLWICASTLWSSDPQVTVRRSVKLMGMYLVVISYFVAAYHPMGVLRVLRNAAFGLCIASILFVLIDPTDGIHQGISEPGLKGAWRGVTTHKNSLGMLCTMTSILWVHAWASGEKSFLKCLPAFVAAVICLVGCRSTTGFVTSVVSASVAWYVLAAPAVMRSWLGLALALTVMAGTLALIFVVTGVPGFDDLFASAAGGVGKDATLTGRDVIWKAVLVEIAKRPWIGNGFQAFWTSQDYSAPAADVYRTIHFFPLQAHNGYLEMMLDVGVIGLGLLLLMIVYQLWQLRQLLTFERRVAGFGLAYTFYDLLLNISEANFLRPTFAPSLIEFTVVAMCARALLQRSLIERAQHLAQMPSSRRVTA